jgi:hypothetical protein
MNKMLKKYLALGIVALCLGVLILGCGQQSGQRTTYSISGTVSGSAMTGYLIVFAGTDPTFPLEDTSWVTTYEAKLATGTSSTYNLNGLSAGTYYVGAMLTTGNIDDGPISGDKLGEYSDNSWPSSGGSPIAIETNGNDPAIVGKDFSLGVTVP